MAVESVGFIDPKTNQIRSQKELDALDKKAADAKAADSAASEDASTDDTSTASALAAVRSRTSQQINTVVGQLDNRKETLDAAKENLKSLRSTAKDLKDAIKSGDDAKADQLRQDFAALQAEREELAKKADTDNAKQRVDGPTLIKVGNSVKASFKFDDIKLKKGEQVDTQSTQGLNQFLDDSEADLAAVKDQIQTDKEVRKQVKQVNKDTRSGIDAIASASDQQSSKQISSLEEAGLVANKIADSIKQNTQDSILSQVSTSQAEKLLGAL